MESAHPRRRRTLWLLLIFCVALTLSSTSKRPEPVYSNQPLSYWVERLADPATSANAASVIGEMGHEAVPALREALKTRPSGLANFGYEVAVKVNLAAPRQYAAEEIRATAAYVIGHLGRDGVEATDDLIEALGDEDHNVRRRASWALARIGKPAATALERATTNAEPVVRIGASNALAEIKRKR